MSLNPEGQVHICPWALPAVLVRLPLALPTFAPPVGLGSTIPHLKHMVMVRTPYSVYPSSGTLLSQRIERERHLINCPSPGNRPSAPSALGRKAKYHVIKAQPNGQMLQEQYPSWYGVVVPR